jgi:hypothetical protein
MNTSTLSLCSGAWTPAVECRASQTRCNSEKEIGGRKKKNTFISAVFRVRACAVHIVTTVHALPTANRGLGLRLLLTSCQKTHRWAMARANCLHWRVTFVGGCGFEFVVFCWWFNDALSICFRSISPSDRTVDEWKWFRRKGSLPARGTILAFTWKDWGNPRKASG